jgi:hypothetical protein
MVSGKCIPINRGEGDAENRKLYHSNLPLDVNFLGCGYDASRDLALECAEQRRAHQLATPSAQQRGVRGLSQSYQ